MREMKDSGIPWIGKIPKEWVICKVKNVVSYIGSGTTPTSGKIEFYENGTVNWIQSGDLYETNKINETNKKVSESAIKLFPALHIYKAKFIVIAMYGASVGNIAISNIDACVNQACCCIKTNEFNNLKYMFYWLFSCKNDFLKITDGGGQPNISQTKIKNQYYLKPPVKEQQRIADYLDTRCSQIDSIRKNVESEIEALKQYKQSVITEAVTKGLDKNVEMKDSGIPWIGKTPKNWEISRLKYILKEPMKYGANESGVAYSDALPRYIRITDIDSEGKLRKDGKLSLNEDIAKRYILKDKSILFARSGGTVGKTFFYRKEYGTAAFAGYLISAVIDEDKALPEWIYYYVNSSAYWEWVNQIYTQSTIQNIGADKYSKMSIPICPNISLQKNILKLLDSKCAKIDSIIQKKQELLAKLDTYKKSLIYEYVTGKKEVPAV